MEYKNCTPDVEDNGNLTLDGNGYGTRRYMSQLYWYVRQFFIRERYRYTIDRCCIDDQKMESTKDGRVNCEMWAVRVGFASITFIVCRHFGVSIR